MLEIVLILIALVLFVLAAFGVPSRLHFGWLGLAVVAVYFLVDPVTKIAG